MILQREQFERWSGKAPIWGSLKIADLWAEYVAWLERKADFADRLRTAVIAGTSEDAEKVVAEYEGECKNAVKPGAV